MRTTVTLDPDVEVLVRERMQARGLSFKRALNDAIREGAKGAPRTHYVMDPVDMGAPRFDLTKALTVANQFEDAELVRKLGLGK
jgi:hypothetical protein